METQSKTKQMGRGLDESNRLFKPQTMAVIGVSLSNVDSIDLNPVICNASGCVVADARMMLSK